MSKSIGLANDTYWDSTSISHNQKPLSDVLNDTGWIDLTPLEGTWTRLQYRQIGDVVHLRGSCSALTYSGSGLKIATGLPGHKGNMSRYFFVPMTGSRISRWYITTSGNLTLEWARNISDASTYTSGSSWYELEYSYCID